MRFNVVALACTLVVALSLGGWLGRQLEYEALGREADIAARDVSSLLTPFLRPSDFTDPLSDERLKEIDTFICEHIAHSQIRRVKIWGGHGEVLYSTDPTAIREESAEGNRELALALAGSVSAEISRSAIISSTEPLLGRLMEIYVPINIADGQVVGAYELYQDMGDVEARIATIHRSVWIGVAVGFGLLYLALLGVVRSASAQLRRRNVELERERATLSGVMRSMGQGLLVLNPDQTIRYGNDQAIRLLNVPGDSLRDASIEMALSAMPIVPERRDAILKSWRECYSQATERPTLELPIQGAVRRDVALELFPLHGKDDGGDVGVLIRDVTSERELERAKDELVSVVSHELRTPLSALVGFADLLLTKPFPPERQKEFLGVMVQEGHRLTGLINDFLDLQRMEAGASHMAAQRVDLSEIVHSVEALARHDARHTIDVTIEEPLPILRADPERLTQVLTNLVSNARKYSPEGGTIGVNAAVVDGHVRVCVSDHGLGLPADALGKLFSKFYRVDNSDRRTIKGTGLGLAICQKIIASHGGQIWAESEGLGQGAQFYFTLPIDRLTAQEGDVLIIEDDPGFGRLIKVELSALGRSATHVTSAEDALSVLQLARPSAVVLDLNLPGTSGEELLRLVPEDFAAEVPVLVVTANHLEKRDRARLAVLGAQGVITKTSAGAARQAAREIAERLSNREREHSHRPSTRAA